MNRLQKVGVAMVIVSGIAFAGYDNLLWFPGIENGQVAFPWVTECKHGPNSTFDETKSDDPCFRMGGWWFGAVYGPSVEANNDIYKCGTDRTKRSGDNKVIIKNLKGGEKTFVGVDNSTCLGPDVASREDGTPNFEGDYLWFEFTIAKGLYKPDYEPNGASIGVGLSTPADSTKPVMIKRKMSQYSKGLCITYTSDHEAGVSASNEENNDLALELDWADKGAPEKGSNEYDTWLHYLEPAATPTVVRMKWEGDFVAGERYSPNKQGDFQQDNWADPSPGKLARAVDSMTQINIRYKGYLAKTINFKLYQFGFYDDCDATTPIIGKKNPSNVNFTLNNRVLSVSIAKSAVVQIYNLQGAVVKSQTLSPTNNQMNLSNLPTGIYMVRAPSLGYTSRIVVK